MKKMIAAVLIAIACTSCHKNDDRLSKAVLVGYDYRMCACCGGLMLNFGNNTKPYDSGFYLVSQLPPGTSIKPTDTFPIKVYIQCQPDTLFHCGAANRIIITELIRQ